MTDDDTCIGGSIDRWMYRWRKVDRLVDGQMMIHDEIQMAKLVDDDRSTLPTEKKGRQMDRWLVRQTERRIDGQMDRKKIDIEMDRQVDSSWRVFEQIQSYIPLGIYIQINMYLWGFNLDIRMGPHRDYEYIDKLMKLYHRCTTL